MNYESKISAENGLYEFTPDGNGAGSIMRKHRVIGIITVE